VAPESQNNKFLFFEKSPKTNLNLISERK